MIHWIWKLRYAMGRRDREIEQLQRDLESVKNALERARVCSFIRIVQYRRGMNLNFETPKPIRLEDLERRISDIEKANSSDSRSPDCPQA